MEVKEVPFKTILAKKIGMTQIFDAQGWAHGVSILEAGPCYIVQVKTREKDGYAAVQLGFDLCQERDLSKAECGHLKRAGVPAVRVLQEVRLGKPANLSPGKEVRIDEMFAPGDYVDVAGISKGKGFAGGMKRWGFKGGPASHGQSDRSRAPGSLAGRRSLGRVLPGKKMAGHLGDEKVTVQKIEVMRVDAQRNLIYLLGSVPGSRGSYATVHGTVKLRKRKIVHEISAKASKKRQTKPAAKK